MENVFPCKECLVKMVCQDHCDKIVSNTRIVDMYITLYTTCPDCGTNLNVNGYVDKQIALCFGCRSGFNHVTIVKPTLDEMALLPVRMRVARLKFNISGPNVITEKDIITTPEPPEYHPPTMEETHDVVFDRMWKPDSIYTINGRINDFRNEIMKPFKKDDGRVQAKYPKLINIKDLGEIPKIPINIFSSNTLSETPTIITP